MRSFTLQCTALNGSNKVGKLKPDDQGYYPVVLGGFDIPNPAGHVYPFKAAKQLFTESSILMRNVEAGTLYGEWGHPKRQPNQTLSNYIKRCSVVHEENIAFHIKKLEINDTDVKDENGNIVVSVIGWVKGAGPNAKQFDDMLSNPANNVCFSIRASTEDVVNATGKLDRNITSIITWDFVVFPGLKVAQKYKSPALESCEESFTEAELMEIREEIRQTAKTGMAMEDETALGVVNEILDSKSFSRNYDLNFLRKRTASSKWK